MPKHCICTIRERKGRRVLMWAYYGDQVRSVSVVLARHSRRAIFPHPLDESGETLGDPLLDAQVRSYVDALTATRVVA